MKKGTLKDIKAVIVSVAAGVAAFVWWGVLFPELCFPEDVYEVVFEEDAEGAEMLSEEDVFEGLLWAGEDRVIVRSRLLEWIRRQMK